MNKTNKNVRAIAALVISLPVLAACGNSSSWLSKNINTKTKFSSSEYGVAASPRLTTGSKVRKGGGRYQVGKPYKVAGRWYRPQEDPNYDSVGRASWYGPNFHGRLTANGEIFDQNHLSAAHPTLPLPSYVRVTNLDNGRSVVVRVNDRGPFAHGREIDLSSRTADVLDFKNQGTAKVRVQYVGRAPLEGDDSRFLMASINAPTEMERNGNTRLAFANSDQLQPIQTAALAPQNVPAPPSRTSLQSLQGGNNGLAGDAAYDSLFSSYADTTNVVNEAHAAANVMASQDNGLTQWQQSMDLDARSINKTLGFETDPNAAHELAVKFAQIAAVRTVPGTQNGRKGYGVLVETLRPGVTKQDLLQLTRSLGLDEFLLYE
ncbi:septal ring lytic transglycosylase RlpA family protein [Maritalea myrionectae]|uniref:septal ring lytic transglycosylase RlpA family protein n=1 Tax=Maritalea myrionectae TaxID=454601 RepID=UPI0004055DB8|nr:septal ring lytic transglycosylase RlpA family protein [Maritalea myrionectae]